MTARLNAPMFLFSALVAIGAVAGGQPSWLIAATWFGAGLWFSDLVAGR